MVIDISDYRVKPDEKIDLESYPTRYEGPIDKKDGKGKLPDLHAELLKYQELLHADRSKSLLIVLQAMDAGGKDSTVRRVFGPLNPNWCRVYSFKRPTVPELAHDFLWRIHKVAPQKGYIGLFNRSHYEDVVIGKVKKLAPEPVLAQRYGHINNFEKLLSDEGTTILKFYLNISNGYQKERLERRLRRPDKFWKFDPSDLRERARWYEYMDAYETAISRCSTEYAPWFVIPAERRWYRDLVIAQIVLDTLRRMNLSYPEPTIDLNEITVE